MRIVKADTIEKAKKIIFDEENVRIESEVFDRHNIYIMDLYSVNKERSHSLETFKRIASYNTETKEMVIY